MCQDLLKPKGLVWSRKKNVKLHSQIIHDISLKLSLVDGICSSGFTRSQMIFLMRNSTACHHVFGTTDNSTVIVFILAVQWYKRAAAHTSAANSATVGSSGFNCNRRGQKNWLDEAINVICFFIYFLQVLLCFTFPLQKEKKTKRQRQKKNFTTSVFPLLANALIEGFWYWKRLTF